MRVFSARMAGLVGITLAGCKGYMDLGDWPTDAGGGTGGISISDGSVSSGGEGGTCRGTCWPNLDLRFLMGDGSVVLLGLAPEDQEPPDCPADAPNDGVIWRTDLAAPPAECASCSCQPPKGSCALPTELAAYYSHPAECPAPMGTPFKAFGAPKGWDGTCTTQDAIPGKPMCSGSTCIQSLMIPPVVVTEPPTCEPALPTPTKLEAPHWGHSARICVSTDGGHCLSSKEECGPTASPGFLTCWSRPGADLPCYGEWSDRHVVYASNAFKDTRGCAACTCGAPAGSTCVASVSVYKDDCCGCSDPGAPAFLTLPVDSTRSTCGDISPPGSALGSKEATVPVYQPGKCAAFGGEPIGVVTGDDSLPDSAYTLCCLTPDIPR
jgi:hypothetical protein